MGELLPEVLRGPTPHDDDHQKSSKSGNLMAVDWIQCFSLYIAIFCHSQPHRITDLLGYQNLAICGSQISTGLHMIGTFANRQLLPQHQNGRFLITPFRIWFGNLPPGPLQFNPIGSAHINPPHVCLPGKYLCALSGMKTRVLVVHIHFADMTTSVIAASMFLVSRRNVIKPYIALIRNEGHIPHQLTIIRTKLK